MYNNTFEFSSKLIFLIFYIVKPLSVNIYNYKFVIYTSGDVNAVEEDADVLDDSTTVEDVGNGLVGIEVDGMHFSSINLQINRITPHLYTQYIM
jgi:hypothetical protein